MRALGFGLGRAALLLFGVVSATYCLLAFIPFTYQAVIQFNMVSWLPFFVKAHPALWAALLITSFALDRQEAGRAGMTRAEGLYYVVHAGMSGALLVHPLLSRLGNTPFSYFASLGFFGSVLWRLSLDFHRAWRHRTLGSREEESARLLGSAWATGLLLPLLHLGLALVRGGSFDLAVLGWNLVAHLLLLSLFAVALLGVASLGRSVSRREGWEIGGLDEGTIPPKHVEPCS